MAVLAAIVIIGAGILALRLFSGEDNWLCQNGTWVKHGNPSEPMPTELCE